MVSQVKQNRVKWEGRKEWSAEQNQTIHSYIRKYLQRKQTGLVFKTNFQIAIKKKKTVRLIRKRK